MIASAPSDVTRQTLEKDELLQRAVVRSLEIIGEASKRIPTELRDANPAVEWREMTRMRDRLMWERLQQ